MAADLCKEFPVASKVFQEAEEAIGTGLKKLMFEGPYVTLSILYIILRNLYFLTGEFNYDHEYSTW